jgi:hypothetical protein
MDKNRITPEDLALRWDVTTKTLSQWRWTGKGPPFFKIGRSIKYYVDGVEEFERLRNVTSTSQYQYIKTSNIRQNAG